MGVITVSLGAGSSFTCGTAVADSDIKMYIMYHLLISLLMHIMT